MNKAHIHIMAAPEIRDPYINRNNQPLIIPNQQFSKLMEAVFKKNKAFRFQAAGYSMSPFIITGDVITLAPVINKVIQNGDVVAYIHPHSKKLMVHRVIRRKKQCLLLKGDNHKNSDGWINREKILGTVVRIERDSYVINLGLGPERVIIAFLSRIHCLKLSVRIYHQLSNKHYKKS